MTPTENQIAGGAASRKRSSVIDPMSVFIFSISASQFILITLGGTMSGTDVMLIIAFVVLLLSGKISIKTKLGKRCVALCSVWLISQILTDIVRHSAFADLARGWSNIGLALVGLCVLYTLLYGHPRRIILYGWGKVAAGFITFFFLPDELITDYPWKFGLSGPVTLSAILIACRKEFNRRQQAILLVAMGAVDILLGARSLGGITLLAGLYLGITIFLEKRAAGGAKLKMSLKVVMALSLVICIYGVFRVYQYVASSGYLGDEAQENYREQSSGKYGLLLGDRAELLSSIPAIIDSPILGHGSWAKDPLYFIEGRRAMVLLGYSGAMKLSPDTLIEGNIPTHSFLLGAWVFAGIGGAIFWAWTWVMVFKSLMRLYPSTAVMLPLMAYASIVMIWDILFSPFGLGGRNQVPYYLVIAMTYYEVAISNAVHAKGAIASRIPKPALNAG
jgi:hypothetical protein